MQAQLSIVGTPGVSLIVQTDAERVVGRGEQCDLIVEHDQFMSRRHFQIRCTELSCVVTDLESTTGTWLNERKIRSSVAVSGDVIRAGETTFEIEVREAGNSTAELSNTLQMAENRQPYSHELAGDTLQLAKLGERATALCRADSKPEQCAAALLAGGCESDALRFMSFALAKPYAIWWACRCLRSLEEAPLTELDQDALTATEAFVRDPTEQNRRAAMALAEKLQFRTAAGWCAIAAFWSAGSIAPPGAPHVPPAPDLTGKAVASAVTLTAATAPPLDANKMKRRFVQLALKIGAGEEGWE